MKRFLFPPAAIALSIFLTACTDSYARSPLVLASPEGEELIVRAEIADTSDERQQGLMMRESLPSDAGMLFTFEQPNVLYFWMQNTLIPLDVLFFDATGAFVSVETMDPCANKDLATGESQPCPSYQSGSPAQFALEVNAGFAEAHGIGTGWVLHMPRK